MKGYGIFVGVDELDLTHYKTRKNFRGARINAKKMYNWAEKEGYNVTTNDVITGPDANWTNITRVIKTLNDRAQYGEDNQLILYISCHGFRTKDPYRSGKVIKYMEFICLYDQMIPENVVRNELSQLKFRRVNVIIDSCFSKGIGIGHLRKRKYKSFEDIYKDNRKKYNRLRKSVKWNGRGQNYLSPICQISAAEIDKKALYGEIGKMSIFTRYLLLVLRQQQFLGDYNDLENLLQEGLPKKRIPKLEYFPNDNDGPFKNVVPLSLTKAYQNNGFKMKWKVTDLTVNKSPLELSITPPSKKYRYFNNIIRRKKASKPNIDLIPVRDSLKDIDISTIDFFLILNVSLSSRASKTFRSSIKIPQLIRKSGGKGNVIFILYDFDHSKVLNTPITLSGKYE